MPDESNTMQAAREEYRRKYGKDMPENKATPTVPQSSYWDRIKAVAGDVHNALRINPPRSEMANKLGADLGYRRNINQAAVTPGGNDQLQDAVFVKRFGNAPVTDQTIAAQGDKDLAAVQERIRRRRIQQEASNANEK